MHCEQKGNSQKPTPMQPEKALVTCDSQQWASVVSQNMFNELMLAGNKATGANPPRSPLIAGEFPFLEKRGKGDL